MNFISYLIYFSTLLFSQNYDYKSISEHVPAFPGAEGFGKYTTGGRGGMIYIVTNLNDSGIGSLRWAVEAKGPRTVVFVVSGNIELRSPIKVKDGNLTIAGQTAPGDGITLQNYPIRIMGKDNIIVRFIRFRLGDLEDKKQDAFTVRNGSSNIMIDHCSFSWGTDETASFYDITNGTIQNCIISEGLQDPHNSLGSLTGGNGLSMYKNLLSGFRIRMPRFTPSGVNGVVDMRNCVVYNWLERPSEGGGNGGTINLYNNYFKPGPASYQTKDNKVTDFFLRPAPINDDPKSFGKFYLEGNKLIGRPEIEKDQWLGVRISKEFDDFFETLKNKDTNGNLIPFAIQEGLYSSTLTADRAFEEVLKFVGASIFRDTVDERVIKDVKSGSSTFKGSKTGLPGIIDSQKDVGGWPKLKSLPAPKDTDRDGMPDEWEIKMGLDPNRKDDSFKSLHPYYTNIEVYLNSLVAHLIK